MHRKPLLTLNFTLMHLLLLFFKKNTERYTRKNKRSLFHLKPPPSRIVSCLSLRKVCGVECLLRRLEGVRGHFLVRAEFPPGGMTSQKQISLYSGHLM